MKMRQQLETGFARLASHNRKARRRFCGTGCSSFDDTNIALICPTGQANFAAANRRLMPRRSTMYFVAAVLVVLAGLFYAAGNHEIGSVGVEVCRYGGLFCENPHYVLTAVGIAAVWGTFVSVK
jgi:hypothetical protein